MITDKRFADYIRSLEPESSPALAAIAARARAEHVPIIRPETAPLLTLMLDIVKPLNVLEIGTAVGYSALLMCGHLPPQGRITTIENYEKRLVQARENFRKYDPDGRIRLLEGDAGDILPTLDGPYDFIFMDAAKGQYINFLPDALRMLPEGGILFADNVLQDGDVIESRYALNRRDRTIHTRMRQFLWEIKHSSQLRTSVVTLGDGVSISCRINRQEEENEKN